MKQIEKCYILKELIKKNNEDFGIELELHKHKNYEEKFTAFKGEGQSLYGVNTENLKINVNLTNKVDKNKTVIILV